VEWAFPHLKRFLHSDDNYWVRTSVALPSPGADLQPLFGGNKDLASVPVYAFWVEKGPFVDLVYFFYYPYNLGKEIGFGRILGSHVGDWEHLTTPRSKPAGTP
jgi:hypothetical protein